MLLDILNRPIKKGDIVLAKEYMSTTYCLATVDKVAKINVYVLTAAGEYEYNPKTKIWKRSLDKIRRMARHPGEIIVVNEQLAYNKQHYPEYQL